MKETIVYERYTPKTVKQRSNEVCGTQFEEIKKSVIIVFNGIGNSNENLAIQNGIMPLIYFIHFWNRNRAVCYISKLTKTYLKEKKIMHF